MSLKSKLEAALVGVAMLFAVSIAGVKIPELGGAQSASANCYGITIYEKLTVGTLELFRRLVKDGPTSGRGPRWDCEAERTVPQHRRK